MLLMRRVFRPASRCPLGNERVHIDVLRVRGLPAGRVSISTGTRTIGPSPQAEWLRCVLEDRSEPPQLYAWTSANLPGRKDAQPRRTRINTTASSSGEVDPRRRIHVLGMGNLGRLFASSLVKAKHVHRTPITLVVHRQALLEQWLSSPGIEITRSGEIDRAEDFDIEWWTEEKPAFGPVLHPGAGGSVANMIVATKAADAILQVDRLRRYLDGTSTVAFVQNGMCKMWPPLGEAYTNRRFPAGEGPNWIACVTTHGVISVAPFKSILASPNKVSVGPVLVNPSPRCGKRGGGDTHDYLMKRIAEAPGLSGVAVSRLDLWIMQLEKLIVNSVINPLTAILRCKNGELIVDRGDDLPRVIDSLIHEASVVLQALICHPASGQILDIGRPGITQDAILNRFSFGVLRDMVFDVAYKVTENTSSMLQHVQAGKPTEIQEVNGWLVETADFLGAAPKLHSHQSLITLVRQGATVARSDLGKYFPVSTLSA